MVKFARQQQCATMHSSCNTEPATVSEATFTFRVDAALKDQFTNAAKSRDRTGAQLLRDFMRDFVQQQQEVAEHDVWFRRQVQAGIDAANAGEVVSAEQVEAEASAWREEMRRKIVQADHPTPSKS
ncbi:MAG: CopG family ribbon-helix-helix protein [Porticoccaceae bacterium]